jgi:hypothetical protein
MYSQTFRFYVDNKINKLEPQIEYGIRRKFYQYFNEWESPWEKDRGLKKPLNVKKLINISIFYN